MTHGWILGYVFLAVLCAAALCSHYREWKAKRSELRASCEHPRWRHGCAYGDPRWPVRTCEDCGLQQHLKAPIPCPHCGENINAGAVKHEL